MYVIIVNRHTEFLILYKLDMFNISNKYLAWKSKNQQYFYVEI